MSLFLDITTSAEFWRKIYPADRNPTAALSSTPLDCVCTAEEALRLAPSWATPDFLEPIDGRLHTLVFDRQLRRSSSSHETHSWSTPVPPRSFYSFDNGAYVMSPAFMFLMAATLLPERKLIAFGCELCGFYGFDEEQGRGFRKRAIPLTTVEDLRRYLLEAKGSPGHRKAERALPHIFERSASPMETFDAMALFGTYRLGGYNIGRPHMNYEVVLSPKAARIAKQSKCFLDMGFPEVLLDVEHQGGFDHSGFEDWAADRARINALQEMGYTVIELTARQVNDLKAFEIIAQRIAKILGKRLDCKKLGATPERLALRREVFDWNQSSGRLR